MKSIVLENSILLDTGSLLSFITLPAFGRETGPINSSIQLELKIASLMYDSFIIPASVLREVEAGVARPRAMHLTRFRGDVSVPPVYSKGLFRSKAPSDADIARVMNSFLKFPIFQVIEAEQPAVA